MKTVAFDEYQVYNWTPKKAERLEYKITVVIKYNNAQVGTLNFYPNDYPKLPGDSLYTMSKGSRVTLNFYENQYEHVLDLMRNESPLYIYISATTGNPGTRTYGEGDIRTSDEPVGEEEGV